MKFELHCHSIHSHGRKITWEGVASPSQIVRVLKRLGIMGFTITDHDSTACWEEARKAAKKEKSLFIPGLEVSTRSGHLIALGISEPIKPRLGLEETIDIIHQQAGLAIAPHPFDIRGEGLGNQFAKADAVEVFNSMNLARTENFLAARKARKLGVPAVGGSDAHTCGMMGMTVNHINADDMDSALKQIKRGNVKITGRYVPVPVVVDWARERMERSYDDIQSYIAKNYSRPKAALSRFLLDRFVGSHSAAWDALGYFSLGVAGLYGVLRLARW